MLYILSKQTIILTDIVNLNEQRQEIYKNAKKYRIINRLSFSNSKILLNFAVRNSIKSE